jgi:hypothetical protein
MGRPVLRARLLGPMDLRFGERQFPPLDSGRAESLLACLLLHRDAPQPRQRLAFLLWPDSAEGQAHSVAGVPGDATAFSHRDANYLFHPISAWLDPADAQRMIAATRAFAAAMQPFGTGASYLNFTHEAGRVRDAYGDATYGRLVALKDTYDPANLFRLNQNIRPSQPGRLTGDRYDLEVPATDGAFESADDLAVVVVGPEHVQRLAVLAERDGTRPGP